MKPTTTTFSEGRDCSGGGGGSGGAEGIVEVDEVVGEGDEGGRIRTRTGDGLAESMNAETSPESTTPLLSLNFHARHRIDIESC